MDTNAATAASPRGVLHFYPGAKRIVWVVRGKVVLNAEAWGGQEVADTVKWGQMRPHRTTAGRFVIHSFGPYKTRTWPWARIRWGTPLKVEGNEPYKYVLYRTGTTQRAWRRIDTLIPSATFAQIRSYYGVMYGKSGLYDPDGDGIPDRWIFNEFGPLAVRYFRDTNNNGVLDEDEHLSGELIHTIPANEAEDATGRPIKHNTSHGCIHISPDDRDRMHKAGAFRKGTTFIVHKYEERVPLVPRPQVNLPKPAEPPTQTRVSRLVPEKTFLDFVVVDSGGKPLGGRRYKLEMPDGSVETGRLGSNAHIEVRNIDPGSARFTLLPDEVAAAPVAAAPAPQPAAEAKPAAEPAEEELAEEEPIAAATFEDVATEKLPTDQIAIRLVDRDGVPIAKQALKIKLANGLVQNVTTDADGRAVLSPVPPGDCFVTIA